MPNSPIISPRQAVLQKLLFSDYTKLKYGLLDRTEVYLHWTSGIIIMR